MKKITDKDFVYVPAEKMGADYLKEKFARIRAEHEAAKQKEREEAAQKLRDVIQIKRNQR